MRPVYICYPLATMVSQCYDSSMLPDKGVRVKEVPLTQGKVALIDDEDYETVIARRCYARKQRNVWYAETTIWSDSRGRYVTVKLHTLLMGPPEDGKSVDHVDGDGLNNQRRNLRWATRSEQRANSATCRTSRSGFKGVYWEHRRQHWCSRLTVNNVVHYLGSYANVEDAARAYDTRAREIFGEFARPNFLS